MLILDKTIDKKSFNTFENFFGNEMIKGVVDIEKEVLAIDAGMHYELEQLLLDNGSKQENLWGINLYPDEDELIEFDSMINIRPNQNNRSRSVEDPKIQEKIRQIVAKWVK